MIVFVLVLTIAQNIQTSGFPIPPVEYHSATNKSCVCAGKGSIYLLTALETNGESDYLMEISQHHWWEPGHGPMRSSYLNNKNTIRKERIWFYVIKMYRNWHVNEQNIVLIRLVYAWWCACAKRNNSVIILISVWSTGQAQLCRGGRRENLLQDANPRRLTFNIV